MSLDADQWRALQRVVDRTPGARLRRAVGDGSWLPANTEVTALPEAVVTCADPAGWAPVVAATHAAGIPVAVRGGGWSPGGAGVVAGGVVLSLEATAAVTPLGGRRFRIQGGALTGAVSAELDAHDVTMTMPVPSGPGFLGAALSGGVGFTFRRDGLVCDAMESAVLVTSAGERIEVDDASDPEVMWALRGGGSQAGLVTEATFTARPQGQVHVHQQVVELALAADVLAWYDGWTADLTRDITSVVMLRNAPPAPGLPATAVGRPALVMTTVHVGSFPDAERDLAPLTSLDSLFARRFPVTLGQLRGVTEAMFQHHRFGVRTASGWSPGLGAGHADALVRLAETMPPGDSVIEVAALGGAVAQPSRPGAAPGRDQRHLLNAMTIWTDPSLRDQHLEWFAASRDVVHRLRSPHLIAPGFADLAEIGTPTSYGAAGRRLAEVRHRLDPENHFRRNVDAGTGPADTTQKERLDG